MPPPAAAQDGLLGTDAAAAGELLLNLLTDAASQRDVSAGVSDVIQVREREEQTEHDLTHRRKRGVVRVSLPLCARRARKQALDSFLTHHHPTPTRPQPINSSPSPAA